MLDLLSRAEPAHGQTTTPRLTLNTKTGCPWCERAKAWLTERGIRFDTVLHDDDAERQALYDRLGLTGSARTVPQAVLEADGESQSAVKWAESGRVLRFLGAWEVFGFAGLPCIEGQTLAN